MSIRDSLLPALDRIRAIGGTSAFGLRRFTVMVRVRQWTGERPGDGDYFDTDTTLVNRQFSTGAGVPVLVKRLTQKDVMASGGQFSDRDYRVGPMTPIYPGGGFNHDTMDPPVTGSATEVLWYLTGPDLPDEGAWFSKVGEEGTAMHYYVTLRATGRTP